MISSRTLEQLNFFHRGLEVKIGIQSVDADGCPRLHEILRFRLVISDFPSWVHDIAARGLIETPILFRQPVQHRPNISGMTNTNYLLDFHICIFRSKGTTMGFSEPAQSIVSMLSAHPLLVELRLD